MMEAEMNRMAPVQHFLARHWEQLIVPLCVLAVTLAVGYAAKRLMVRLLRPWAARSKGPTAQIVINAVKGPFMSNDFLAQLSAIQCNPLQSTAISPDELQSGCGMIAPFCGELHRNFSLCRP